MNCYCIASLRAASVALSATGALAVTSDLQADIVTLTISGRITSVDPLLTNYYSVDSAISVVLTYEATQGQSGPDDNYYASHAEVFTNGHQLIGDGGLAIQNNVPFDEAIFPYIPMSGLTIAPFQTPELYVNFIDYSSSIFSGNGLPRQFPSLSQWDWAFGNIGYEDAAANMSRRVNFSIDQMSVTPAPSAAPLLALAALSARGRRRK